MVFAALPAFSPPNGVSVLPRSCTDAAEAVQAARRLERGARARVRPERFEHSRRRDELERRCRAERLPGILRVERLPAREAPHLDPPERGLEPGTSDGRLDRLAQRPGRRIASRGRTRNRHRDHQQ
jgi:hypothetical protein